MTTIRCTITPPLDCLARLAACPALPRGERLRYAHGRTFLTSPCRHVAKCAISLSSHWHIVSRVFDRGRTLGACMDTMEMWRSMARPLRVARERLREAREVIAYAARKNECAVDTDDLMRATQGCADYAKKHGMDIDSQEYK